LDFWPFFGATARRDSSARYRGNAYGCRDAGELTADATNCRRFFKERICFNDFFSLGSIRCNDGRHNFLPLAHRGARVIGTDALRILVISQEAGGGKEGNQDNEDNPNIDAHQSRLLPPVRTRRYTEAKESPRHEVAGLKELTM
jgi:hypothetical protein